MGKVSSVMGGKQKANNNRFQAVITDLKNAGLSFRMNDLDEAIEYSLSNGELSQEWRRMADIDEAIIRCDMREFGYGVSGTGKAGVGALRDAITKVANQNRYNNIHDYFRGLDGKYKPDTKGPYIIPQLAKFFSNPDGVFDRWLFKWMVGTVAKSFTGARNPMLVLVGEQGTGKSFFAEWICPIEGMFMRDSINPDDKDSHIRLTDTLIWEVEELGATTRRSDVESLKAFITRDFVKKRPAYGRTKLDKPSVCSFLGTVNHDGAGFLNDYTGSTRFLACEVNDIIFDYSDVCDVDESWAEAVWFYKTVPGSWQLSDDEKREQAKINARFEVPSAVFELVEELFEITGNGDDWMATHDIKAKLKIWITMPDQLLHREMLRVLKKLKLQQGRKVSKGNKHRRGFYGIRERIDGVSE